MFLESGRTRWVHSDQRWINSLLVQRLCNDAVSLPWLGQPPLSLLLQRLRFSEQFCQRLVASHHRKALNSVSKRRSEEETSAKRCVRQSTSASPTAFRSGFAVRQACVLQQLCPQALDLGRFRIGVPTSFDIVPLRHAIVPFQCSETIHQ